MADRNNDGTADILWKNTSTQDLKVWLMNGASVSEVSLGTVPAGLGLIGGM